MYSFLDSGTAAAGRALALQLLRFSILLFSFIVLGVAALADRAAGRFEGQRTFKQLDDEKTCEVVSPFAFVAGVGRRWA